MIRATSIEFPAVRRSGSRASGTKRFQNFGTEPEKQLLVIDRLTIDERSPGIINGNGSVDDLVFPLPLCCGGRPIYLGLFVRQPAEATGPWTLIAHIVSLSSNRP